MKDASSPLLHRIDRLNETGRHYLKKGDREQALAAFEASLAAFEALDEAARQAVAAVEAGVHNHIGALVAATDPARAMTAHQRALKIFEELAREDPSYENAVVNTRLMLAGAYQKARKFYYARKHYKALLDWYRGLMPERRRAHRALAAAIYWNLGDIALEESKAIEAEEKLNKAFALYRELVTEVGEKHRPMLAATLNNLAVACKLENRYSDAINYYKATLQEYEQLAEKYPDAFLPYYAATLHQLGNAFVEKKDVRDAIEDGTPLAGFGLLTMAREEKRRREEADRRQAEAYYRKALEVYRNLMAHDARYAPHVATVIHNLGVLYDEHQNPRRALQYYEEALARRRALAQADPETFNADVCITIFNILTLLLDRAERGDAAAFSEAEALMKEARRRLAIYPQDDGVIGGMKADLDYYQKHFARALSNRTLSSG